MIRTNLEDGHVKVSVEDVTNPRTGMVFPHATGGVTCWVVRQYCKGKTYYYVTTSPTEEGAYQIASKWMDTGVSTGIAVAINR